MLAAFCVQEAEAKNHREASWVEIQDDLMTIGTIPVRLL